MNVHINLPAETVRVQDHKRAMCSFPSTPQAWAVTFLLHAFAFLLPLLMGERPW